MKSHRKVKSFVVFRTPLNHICDFKSTSDLKSYDLQNMPVLLVFSFLFVKMFFPTSFDILCYILDFLFFPIFCCCFCTFMLSLEAFLSIISWGFLCWLPLVSCKDVDNFNKCMLEYVFCFCYINPLLRIHFYTFIIVNFLLHTHTQKRVPIQKQFLLKALVMLSVPPRTWF